MIELTLEQIIAEYEPHAKDRDLVFQGEDCYDIFNAVPDTTFDYLRENYNALISYSPAAEDVNRDRFYVVNTDIVKVKY